MDMMKAEDAGFTSSTKKGDAEKETRFGIRLYLTNQRLIVVGKSTTICLWLMMYTSMHSGA